MSINKISSKGLHIQAMELVDRAEFAFFANMISQEKDLFRQAAILEWQAFLKAQETTPHTPANLNFVKNAAAMALRGEEYHFALQCLKTGLSLSSEKNVKKEFKMLFRATEKQLLKNKDGKKKL